MCPDDCKLGCKDDLVCSLCADDFCIECLSFNKNYCSVCKEGRIAKDGNCVLCEDGRFYKDFKCLSCVGLCKNCLSESICTSCQNNSYLAEDGQCLCSAGYHLSGSLCERTRFSFVFGIFQNNSIWFLFNESLILDQNHVKVSLTDSVLRTARLIKIDENLYNLELELEGDAKKGSKAKIDFSKTVTSLSNSLLICKTVSLRLFETSTSKENQDIEHEQEMAKDTARKTTMAAASAATAASLFTGDLNSVFSFLSIAEMIYSAYLFDFEMYLPLVEFILGLRVHSLVPNLFNYFISWDQGIVLPEKLQKYGFKTNLVLFNCGIQFTLFVTFFIFYWLLFALMRISVIEKNVAMIFEYFRFGVFIRLMIQSYLELLYASVIGIKFRDFSSGIQIFNFIICLIFLVLANQAFIILSAFSAVFILVKANKLKEEAIKARFRKKYLDFFDEFKENSIVMNLFYVIYMIRRIILAMLIFLDFHKFLQIIVSAVMSLSVKFI